MSQVIPEGWLEQPIGNIANVIAGGTPKAGNPNNFAMPGSEIAWLTPADLSKYNSKSISYGARDLSQEGYDSSSAKLMPKGALLFSSRAPIGYVVIAENPICTNQGFKSFVFTEQVYSTYAFYYLKSIRDLAESLGSGTTFKELSGATAKTIPFRLAPLAEQKIIADKLDELLAQVESTKARLDAVPAILKSFRQSVLAAAVSGKLTGNNRIKDSAYADLIQDEINSDKKLKKLKHLSCEEISLAKSMHGEVNWEHWSLMPLELLVESERGVPYGIVQTGVHCDGGVPTVRCGDVKPLEILKQQLKRVDKNIEKKYKRTSLNGGEVLLAIRGTVGNAAVATSDMYGFNISREVAMIPVRTSINPDFIALLLQSPTGYRCLAEKVRGVAQKGINLADVKRFVTPLPSLEEQTEIVRRVVELFAFADKVEAQVNVAQTRVNNLTRSILAKAFKGELTAEWRAANPDLISGDNSAKALLERIKAERESLAGRKKPAKKLSSRNKI